MGELKALEAFQAFVKAVLSPGMTWTPWDKEKAFIPHCEAIVENCDPMVVKGHVADFLMHAIDQSEAMVADFLNHVDRMLDMYTRERHFTSEDIERLCEFLTRFKSGDARLTKFRAFLSCLSQTNEEHYRCLVVSRNGGKTLAAVLDNHRGHIFGMMRVRFQDIQDVMSQHTELLAYARTAQTLMQTGTMKPELTGPLHYHLCLRKRDNTPINLDDSRMRLDKKERDSRRFNDQTRYANYEIKRLGITRTDTHRYDPWSNPDAETVKALKGHCDWLRSMVCSKPAGLPYELKGLHTRPYMTIILELKTLFKGAPTKYPDLYKRKFRVLRNEQCFTEGRRIAKSANQAIFAHFRAANAIGEFIIGHARRSEQLIHLMSIWHSCYKFMWQEFDAFEKELTRRSHPALAWFKRLRTTVYDILTPLMDAHCLEAGSRLSLVDTSAERAEIVTCGDVPVRMKRHPRPDSSPKAIKADSTPSPNVEDGRLMLRRLAREAHEDVLADHEKVRVKHEVINNVLPTEDAIKAAMKDFLTQAAPASRVSKSAPATRTTVTSGGSRPFQHVQEKTSIGGPKAANAGHRTSTPVRVAKIANVGTKPKRWPSCIVM